MTKPTYATGDVPTATEFNEFLVNVNFARKTSTESVTSSTTLQDDDELSVAVIANAIYEVTCLIRYDGAVAGDLKVDMSLPAGASMVGIAYGVQSASVAGSSADDFTADFSSGTPATFGAAGTGSTSAAKLEGLLVMSSTAGNAKVQWAQVSSSVAATRVFAQSYLSLRRVS